MKVSERPVLTETYETLSVFSPGPDSSYIFGTSHEERSAHSQEWEAARPNVDFVRIISQFDDRFTVDLNGATFDVALRSLTQLRNLLSGLARRSRLYIDITGLEHQVWAPLIRSALDVGIQTYVVYVEPGDYRLSATRREGEIFDLSERINGVAPLPGFASLNELDAPDVPFVALLGFEGIRFRYVLEVSQPSRNKIIPIVGVPGFRPEYPFYTYDGNRPVLEDNSAWVRVRFAKANCPFSLWYTLKDVALEHPAASMKIAMIGTKPHAVGAILFYFTHSEPVELVYDHPKRKEKRTEGSSRVLVYAISAFVKQ